MLEASEPMGEQGSEQQMALSIRGMGCGSCVRSIQDVLGAVVGVRRVSVSLEQSQAQVWFDPQQTGRQALATAVEAAGYQVP